MSKALQQILCEGLSVSPNAVALFDPHDGLAFANEVFRVLYLVGPAPDSDFAGIMRHCHASGRGLLIESDDLEGWLAGVLSRRRKAPVRTYEADFSDGRWLWVTETLLPDGWLYYNGTDITALKYNESALQRARDAALAAANSDPLTGLGNRRVMLAALQRALGGSGVGCMIDLDHFKKINDTYGHPVGDRVLCHFAQFATAQLRPVDQLTRIGGEEFFLLLPGASPQQAEGVLERLRGQLRADSMFSDLPALRYTFSAGATAFRPGDEVDAILRRADQALYQAKQSGRDCHALADQALR